MRPVCYIWQTPEFRKKIGKIMQEVYDDYVKILKKNHETKKDNDLGKEDKH